MAASTGFVGKGVAFKIGTNATTPVFTAVGNVTSINRGGVNSEEIDFTHLGSTGGYREFQQGFKDGGTISVDFHFDPAATTHMGTGGLLGLFNSGATFPWRIDFSGAGKAYALQGVGYVQNPGDLDVSVDSPVTGSATIRVTGEATRVSVP